MPTTAPKIVIIGAGGVTFPVRLIMDILSFDALKNSTISLYDIHGPRLKRTARMAASLIRSHNLPTKLEVTTDRREALRHADYILITFQVGGLEPYKIDKDVSRKFGVDLCVGDTLNAGGIFRGLRSLGALAEIARDMKELCPAALMINYANPMAINCWGMNNMGIRTVGLCHSVQGTTRMLAGLIDVDYTDLTFKCYGINHQAWITEFRDKGKDVYPRLRQALLKRFPSPAEAQGEVKALKSKGAKLAVDHNEDIYHQEQVRTELVRTFGYFQTESSHHGSEYLPWFRKNDRMIKSYLARRWDYYQCCAEFDLEKQVKMVEKMCTEPLTCSEEYGAKIINAVVTHQPTVVYGNVPNFGAPGASRDGGSHLIPNLPQNACVEVACLVDGNGIQPTTPGPLPPQLAAINRTNINVQELAVLAHETGDPQVVEQSVAMDPLTGALLTLPQIRALTKEMLTLQKRWLPQFRHKS